MSSEWSEIPAVPARLPDRLDITLKPFVPFAYIEGGEQTVKNEGDRDLMSVSFRLYGTDSEFFRLCHLNAAALVENGGDLSKLERIRI